MLSRSSISLSQSYLSSQGSCGTCRDTIQEAMPTPAAPLEYWGASANSTFNYENRTDGSIGADLLASVAPDAKGEKFLFWHGTWRSDELPIWLQSAKRSAEGNHKSAFCRPSNERSSV
jgi:hypothetical protein